MNYVSVSPTDGNGPTQGQRCSTLMCIEHYLTVPRGEKCFSTAGSEQKDSGRAGKGGF